MRREYPEALRFPGDEQTQLMMEVMTRKDPIGFISEISHEKDFPLPKSVGIIADGNGRWAAARGLPVTAGHAEGAKRLIELIRSCRRLDKIETVAIWAMSPDNFKKREGPEISGLMGLVVENLNRFLPELMSENGRFVHLGWTEGLPRKVSRKLKRAEELTAGNTGQTIVFMYNYNDVTDTTDKLALVHAETRDGRLVNPSRGDYEQIINSGNVKPLEMLIRTGGDSRTSGLGRIVGQAQLYFVRKTLPEFTERDFAIELVRDAFAERRLGGRPETQKSEKKTWFTWGR